MPFKAVRTVLLRLPQQRSEPLQCGHGNIFRVVRKVVCCSGCRVRFIRPFDGDADGIHQQQIQKKDHCDRRCDHTSPDMFDRRLFFG